MVIVHTSPLQVAIADTSKGVGRLNRVQNDTLLISVITFVVRINIYLFVSGYKYTCPIVTVFAVSSFKDQIRSNQINLLSTSTTTSNKKAVQNNLRMAKWPTRRV